MGNLALPLVEELKKHGVKLYLDNGKLKVIGQLDTLPKGVFEQLKQNKTEVVEYLRQEQVKKVTQLLREQGWVAVKSHVLGEVVLWTRDKKVAVPERWSNAVIYTLEELQALVNEPVRSAAELKGIHAAKKIFEGELVNLEHNGGT